LLAASQCPPVRSASTTPSTADLTCKLLPTLRPAIPAAPYGAPERFLSRRFSTLPLVTMFRGSPDLGDASNDVDRAALRRRLLNAIILVCTCSSTLGRPFRHARVSQGANPRGWQCSRCDRRRHHHEDPVTDPRERLKRYGQEDHVPSTKRLREEVGQCRLPCDSSDPAMSSLRTDRVRLGLHLGETTSLRRASHRIAIRISGHSQLSDRGELDGSQKLAAARPSRPLVSTKR